MLISDKLIKKKKKDKEKKKGRQMDVSLGLIFF